MVDTVKDLKIGFGITGSFCTISKIIPIIAELTEKGAKITPILSDAVASCDTRFGKAADLKKTLTDITGGAPMTSLPQVEPIGPKGLLDVLVIAPCTGNSIAKIANGISDTPVTLAAKSHLRNNRPVVLAVSTNDGLGGNAKNIGSLLSRKNIYLVPFKQDNCIEKESSLVADFSLIEQSLYAALTGQQLQPVLI